MVQMKLKSNRQWKQITFTINVEMDVDDDSCFS